MMKVIRIHAYGGPEVMQLEEQSLPEPDSNEAHVCVIAAGVNFSDLASRRAPLPLLSTKLPTSLGIERTGIIEAVGPHVTTLRVGERVT